MEKTAPIVIKRTFPWSEKINGTTVTYRLMDRDDAEAITAFGATVDENDLVYMHADISQREHVDEWMDAVERGRSITVLAESGGKLIGYASLHHNEMTWTSHMGEMRVIVDKASRGLGIGKRLMAEVFHIAREMDLDRVYSSIPADRLTVRQLMEQLGFQAEAVLPSWLKDRKGATHDMLIMSRPTE